MEKTELAAIIKECQEGKNESFAYIVSAFQQQICRFCYHLLGSAEDAKDASSEIFMKTFINISRFDENQQFSSWLFRIAHNHCISILRKKKLEWKFLQSQLLSARATGYGPPPHEEHYCVCLQKDEIHKALKALPHQYTAPLLLRYQFELSYAEIAKVIDKPLSSVKVLIFRGKKKLRKIMGQEY
ncbi:RNA polymerase sigma factor [Thermodesulfobacteriota bacterium]